MSSATIVSVVFIALDEACAQEVVCQNAHRVTPRPGPAEGDATLDVARGRFVRDVRPEICLWGAGS